MEKDDNGAYTLAKLLLSHECPWWSIVACLDLRYFYASYNPHDKQTINDMLDYEKTIATVREKKITVKK